MPAPATNAASVARGEVVFNSSQTQCASCHVGAQGTNGANMNVGTGGLFQVPRLVELGWRTQWLHDGRVVKPADRFTRAGGGESHGHAAQLTPLQQADLLEYLKSR